MRLNNYNYNYKFPKLTLKKIVTIYNYIYIIIILGSIYSIIMQLAATKQLAQNGASLSILHAFHKSYAVYTGPGSIIIRCKKLILNYTHLHEHTHLIFIIFNNQYAINTIQNIIIKQKNKKFDANRRIIEFDLQQVGPIVASDVA